MIFKYYNVLNFYISVHKNENLVFYEKFSKVFYLNKNSLFTKEDIQ